MHWIELAGVRILTHSCSKMFLINLHVIGGGHIGGQLKGDVTVEVEGLEEVDGDLRIAHRCAAADHDGSDIWRCAQNPDFRPDQIIENERA